MKIIERIDPVGPWFTQPVTAIVECEPDEVENLPGVVWHGVALFTDRKYHAHLEGHDIETANAIMLLDLEE